jgi:hypothetical protein
MEKNSIKVLEQISSGISLIFAGVFFLGVTLNYFSIRDIIILFSTIWPLFIIIAGVKLLLSTSIIGRVVAIFMDIVTSGAIIALLVLGITV